MLRLAVVAAILTVVIWKFRMLTNLDVRALIQSTGSGPLSVLLVLGVYALKSVLFVVPASMIYISVGLAFPFLPALFINAGGLFIELNLTYFLGRFLGGNTVERKLHEVKYGDKILLLRDKKPLQLFIVRLLPVFPIDFVSLFFGATKMNYLKYLLLSFFGIMPRIFIITFFGVEVYELFPKRVTMTLVIFCIVGAAIFGTIKYIQKNKRDGSAVPEKIEEENN